VQQRAKFEGWLKFELAAAASRDGATDVRVEVPLPACSDRGDLGFTLAGEPYLLELKTPNSNWRLTGVESRQRPISKNISAIGADVEKMERAGGGIVAFVLFPVPNADQRWVTYLQRISVELDASTHCSMVDVPLPGDHSAIAVVCAFPVAGVSQAGPQ
jgi:hypothetical protein